MNKILSKSCFFGVMAVLQLVASIAFAAERFEGYEIRVIRPKYFSKRDRFELGAQLSTVTNQSFIYTYLATGLATYHFTEQMALEASGAYGLTINKEDKNILKNTFEISTNVVQTQYVAEGALLYTPIYGKYQLTSGKLIYFDTYLALGGGMTGVYYGYDHCADPNTINNPAAREKLPAKPDPKTVSYPGFVAGLGQRFFLNTKDSLNWNIRVHGFMKKDGDSACSAEEAETITTSSLHNNVTLQLGASRFF